MLSLRSSSKIAKIYRYSRESYSSFLFCIRHCAASFCEFSSRSSSRRLFFRVTYEKRDAVATSAEIKRYKHCRPDDGHGYYAKGRRISPAASRDVCPTNPMGKYAGRNRVYAHAHTQARTHAPPIRSEQPRPTARLALRVKHVSARRCHPHLHGEQHVANTVSSSSICYRQVHLLPRVLSTLMRTSSRVIAWNATSSTKFDELCSLRCCREG